MLEFTWPWAFAALPVPLLIYWFVRRAPRQDAALYVPFYSQLSQLHSDASHTYSKQLLTLLTCIAIWLLIVVAASRPQWVGEPIEMPSTGRDLMLVLDVSGSMEARDMVINNTQLSRFQVMKAVVGDFVERREGDRLGLVLFAAHAYIQTPLTFDRGTVGQLVEELEIGMVEESATAIGDAIGLGIKHLRNRPENSRVMVMLTDGVNNAGLITPTQAGQLAQTESIRIYTIGLGADSMMQRSFLGARNVNPSSEIDEENLTEIAEMTGGQYFRARSLNDLIAVYAELDRLEPIEQDPQTYRPTKLLFHWPLGAAFIVSFLLAVFSLPWMSLQSSRQSTRRDQTSDMSGNAAEGGLL